MQARDEVLAMQEGGQLSDTVTLTLPRTTAVAYAYPPHRNSSRPYDPMAWMQACADIRGACRIVLNPVAEREPVTPDHGADELRDSTRPGK